MPSINTTPPAPSSSQQAKKRRPWLLYIIGGLLAFLLLTVATVAITVWWLQRPIKPVVLSAAEKATVEAKLQQITSASSNAVLNAQPDRVYEPGTNVLQLTEREINGLLNENSDLGKSVRLELGRDAINAYIAAPIPDDVPMFGGKTFKARGRFRVSLGNGDAPVAMLEDLTVYGVSLPKAWLGGIKGQNLIGDAMGKRDGTPLLKGVKSLRVEPGVLVLELEK